MVFRNEKLNANFSCYFYCVLVEYKPSLFFRWIIDPPLEVTVPAKRTPWPDATPELLSSEKLTNTQESTEKRATKTRTPRSKHSSRKRKHEARSVDKHISTSNTGKK